MFTTAEFTPGHPMEGTWIGHLSALSKASRSLKESPSSQGKKHVILGCFPENWGKVLSVVLLLYL